MKILVTGAGALLGQGIIQSIRRSALGAEIVAVDPSRLSAGLYWADRAYLVAMAVSPAYAESIHRVLRLERPDVVLIGTDVELMFFAEQRETLETEYKTKIIVSPPRVVSIADDKWATVEFLREHGFTYADSALPGTEDSLIARVGFPLIVKPRVGARAVGVSVSRSREELDRALSSLPAPIIQEYVGDDASEYTAGIIVFDGKARASIVMRRDLRDGNTFRAYVEDYPDLNDEVRSIAETLNPYGPVNLQFRVHKGRVVPFEINARFSGTTPLREYAGFNEVEMVVRYVLENKPVEQPPIRSVVILRHLSETIVTQEQVDSISNAPGFTL
jgi:carbamoyl-phosphate synthase large subunit